MTDTYLTKIIEKKREWIESVRPYVDLESLRANAIHYRDDVAAYSDGRSNRLKSALETPGKTNIIAEFKRASPSKGSINEGADIESVTRQYEEAGACAISILTEEFYFKGSIDDLTTAKENVAVPILQKDFILEEFQVFQTIARADACLLIVAALERERLLSLMSVAHEYNKDVIVEVHDLEELEIAASLDAPIIGVNNRDLKTFKVSLDVSRELIKQKPSGSLMISESGISTKNEIEELRSLGFDGFLIGETLMRSGDPRSTLESLI